MAHVGGIIASAILGVVSKQIMSAINGQIKLQWNFVSDLEKMRSSLETVEALLEDAERRSIMNLAVRLWLGRLKVTMYEISDMINDFEVNTEPAAQKCCPQISVSRLKMAKKMKNMREQLKGITEDRIPFTFMQENVPSVQEVRYNRETAAAVTEAQVVGRDKEKLEIMDRLSGSITKEITILPIYGIGGIGKTTMAQLVFKDSQFKEYSRAWVYVSETFDLKKIGNSIISQLSNSNSQHTDLQMIENNLQEELISAKKVLIILDDLWEREPHQLERLKTMLELGEGSKVVAVVTTREEYIAQKIQTVEPGFAFVIALVVPLVRSAVSMVVERRFFIMHDLVHDLARSVLADEINIEGPTCRYACLTDYRKLFNSSVTPLAKIRALHFHDFGYFQFHGDAFSRAKCLRVLDLSGCFAEELPDSIGQLKQLRCLDASWELNFRYSSEGQPPRGFIMIPKALGALTKLQYLNLSGRGRLIGLPEVISKLMELRYLNISTCKGYYSLDSPSANQSFIDCIGTLPNLEQLDLSFNNYSFSVPESFSSLKKLNLFGCEHIAGIPENVAKLDIQSLFGLLEQGKGNRGLHVRADDSESSSSLFLLKHTNPNVLGILNLENVKSVEEARSIRLMEKQNIESLSLLWSRDVSDLEHMELLTELVPPINVKDLRIIGYEGAIFPYWVMDISKYLPNLVSLEMSRSPCSSLPSLVQLPNLRKIVLSWMDNLEEFNTCSLGEDGANELTLPKLEYRKLDGCLKLRIKPCPPKAVHWFISSSDDVLSSWGERASSAADSSSSPPVSKLEVDSELPLHKWRLLHHLPGLSDLMISHCNDLSISPQIAQAYV